MMADVNRRWNISELVARLRVDAEASGMPVIDLGQGAPVDPTPDVVVRALQDAGQAPRYPRTQGTQALRAAYGAWANRRFDAQVPLDGVIPTLGSKELIAGLPNWLGLSSKSLVVIPALAYPTYEYGAARVGAEVVASDSLLSLGPRRPACIWLNTPSNPTGKVLPVSHLQKVVSWARERGTLVLSDECYVELGNAGQEVPSILSPEVNGGSHEGLLAVHSLSKRSSMAGYRIGFVSGDVGIVADLTKQRRDLGLILADPLQAVAVAALSDDEHVVAARSCYAQRRLLLTAALRESGFTVEPDQGGLFVWATSERQDIDVVADLASRGLIAAPGSFYGPRGAKSVRLSLTVPDEQLAEAAERIVGMGSSQP